jgi:FkbM family methyltransferase
MMSLRKNLIFDIGLHKGEDTVYYLRKGYEVVAVEANPQLAAFCREKFKKAIENGKLTILNVGIANKNITLPFYINKHSSEWSSFDKSIGTRKSPDADIVKVPCVTTKSLFEKYGVPYYMKVDIEGYDHFCLNDIPEYGDKPQYISCEAVHLEWLDILRKKGYTKFKLINQADGFNTINIKREKARLYPFYRYVRNGLEQRARKVIPFRYASSSSGPFGEKSKGKWKVYEETKQSYLEFFRGESNTPVNNVSWWDFHAAL